MFNTNCIISTTVEKAPSNTGANISHNVSHAGSNGGTVSGSDSVVRTVYYGDRIGSLPTAEKMNHKFLGWNTNQNGSGFYVQETYIANANITLYAIFKLQANCYTKQSSKYKTGMMYRKDGKYSTGIVKVKVNGKYKDATI